MPAASVNQPTSPHNWDQLEISVRRIFDQAQTSNANHRKNYVALYKLHTEFAAHKELLNKGRSMKLTGERQFERLFSRLILYTLPVKKGVASADRIVKFIAGYIKFINEKALEDNSDESDDEEDGTTASRFTAKLLTFLLPGFLAKDKNVRYRVLQIIAEMISYLGQIDEEIYKALCTGLINRLNDRESIIRSQAVISLIQLCASEDANDLDGERSILQILLDTMSNDASVDVRRTVVLKIPVNAETLPGVLDRMHDVDANVRKVVYSKVLATNVTGREEEEGSEIIGSAHPRTLTISQRIQIVQTGLEDRDLSVSSAAAALLATWVDVIDIKNENGEVKAEEQSREKLETGVLSLLGLFDLQEGSIAKIALSSIFVSRVDILDNIGFEDNYWANLTPEKAFLARVFVEYCKANKDDTRLEATIPVVTLIAFRIQEAYNMLDDILLSTVVNEGPNDDPRNKRNDEKLAREIVISELLKLAVHLDYSDEIGRRKTFQLVRDMLRSETLPEILIAPCLDVLRTLSATEGELIRLVVEAIQELREAIYGEDELEIPAEDIGPETSLADPKQNATSTKNQNMSPEQKLLADEVDLRCLLMCIGMLERVNGTLEKNITLEALLEDLIIPSVQREELIFKERGIKSLGLCCLIAKPLALKSIGFFMMKVASSTPALKVALLQSVFDTFMVHETAMFKDKETTLEAVTSFLITNILEDPDPSVKAVLCEGTAKLIFSGLITSIEALKTLIKAFFSPLTAGNQKLRQCLAVFFQTYSHSSRENQKRMADIFIHVFLDASEDRKNVRDADRDVETIGSSQVAAMFADWTDPLRLSHVLKAPGTHNKKAVNYCIQIEMAEDILKVLFEKDLKVDIEKDDKKVLCQLLNKLHIPDVVDDYRIRSLKLLMDNLKMRRPLRDSASKTAFTKFESTLVEKFEQQLEGFSEAEYRKLEELNELFEFLDSVIPLDEEYDDLDVPKKGRKRRSESLISRTTESRSCSPLPSKDRVKRKSKRARLSTPDEDFKNREDEDGMPHRSTIATRRTLPKRAAAAKRPQQVIVITSDSDEGQDSESAKRVGARLSTSEEEAEIDKQMDKLLISNASSSNMSEVPYDSIMDTDSEEEDEVNDLLAAD